MGLGAFNVLSRLSVAVLFRRYVGFRERFPILLLPPSHVSFQLRVYFELSWVSFLDCVVQS